MKSVLLFLLLSVFVAVNGMPDPRPGVHRVTGQYVTHRHRITGKYVTRIHTIKIPITNRRGDKEGSVKIPEPPNNNRCKQGLITGTINKVNDAIHQGTGGIADALGANKKRTGLLGNLAGGIENFVNGVAGGINQATSDFFCGFNRVFTKLGSGINKGDLLGGLVNGLTTFVTGTGDFIGNLGANGINAIRDGLTNVLKGRQGAPTPGNAPPGGAPPPNGPPPNGPPPNGPPPNGPSGNAPPSPPPKKKE